MEKLKGEEVEKTARDLRASEEEALRGYLSEVREIIEMVRREGDKAIIELTKRFDGVDISKGFFLGKDELELAYEKIGEDIKSVFRRFVDRVESYHKNQVSKSWMDDISGGGFYGMMIIPMDRVGVYIPGGKAVYPSTVFMATIPAKIAGVREIYGFTPPPPRNEILAAFYMVGVDGVYTIGGAQAVAAATFGTETVKKMDKIVGPGNIYVNLAKKELFGLIGIDSLAGPSEVLIITDGSCDPSFISHDLAAQLEHDEMAKAVLISTSESAASKALDMLHKIVKESERKNILEKSIKNLKVYIVDSLDDGIRFSNAYCPEHLELLVEDPFSLLFKVKCAGAVFLGSMTPTALGDYGMGPNHILPTGGAGRFSSPLGVYDFYRRISFLKVDRDLLNNVWSDMYRFSLWEGLPEHGRSIKIRRDS